MSRIDIEQFMVCESVDEVGGEVRGHAIRLRTTPGEIRENVIALVRLGRSCPAARYSFRVYHEDVAGAPHLLGSGPALEVTPAEGGSTVFVLHAGPVHMPGPGRYVFVLFQEEQKIAEREYVFGAD